MKGARSRFFLAAALSFLLIPNAKAGEREDNFVMLAMSGSLDGVREMLDQGVNVNAKDSLIGCTALVGAAQYDHAEVVQLLLARGADINMVGYGYTPLTIAALNGNADIVRILIDRGADVNKPDENKKNTNDATGQTALMRATDVLENGKMTGLDKSFHIIYTPLTPKERGLCGDCADAQSRRSEVTGKTKFRVSTISAK